MNRLVRKIVPDSELYTELYKALFTVVPTVKEKVEKSNSTTAEPTKEHTADCSEMVCIMTSSSTEVFDFTKSTILVVINACLDIYSSLINHLLVYNVFIWDDS